MITNGLERNRMLEMLHKVKFEMIDPPDIDEIGFTERNIWINAKGYGYLACDEPDFYFVGREISEDDWLRFIEKYEKGTLNESDIEYTSIKDLILAIDYTISYKDVLKENWFEIDNLREISPINGLFCMQDFEGFKFFNTKEELDASYERDWADYVWDELEDAELEQWINYIFGK